ncbi:hypothetical protein [Reinekea sp.]|jgi:hypothetical protein|uniref:hypothetical protein n=1 Tax=Reinekea sp. TaxID=1970455 RepID=UPI00398A0F97
MEQSIVLPKPEIKDKQKSIFKKKIPKAHFYETGGWWNIVAITVVIVLIYLESKFGG